MIDASLRMRPLASNVSLVSHVQKMSDGGTRAGCRHKAVKAASGVEAYRQEREATCIAGLHARKTTSSPADALIILA